MLRSSTTSYYQADGLGSITSLSSGAGALAQTYTFDSFGKQTASSGSLTNPFQYTARESDPETGLYYYRARYYDPSAGRFLSEDPIDFAGGRVAQTIEGGLVVLFSFTFPFRSPLAVSFSSSSLSLVLGAPHVGFTCEAFDFAVFVLFSWPPLSMIPMNFQSMKCNERVGHPKFADTILNLSFLVGSPALSFLVFERVGLSLPLCFWSNP